MVLPFFDSKLWGKFLMPKLASKLDELLREQPTSYLFFLAGLDPLSNAM